MAIADPSMAVIIPTYNRSAWVIRAVECVLAQQEPFLKEIIVVDQTEDVPAAQEEVLASYDRQKRIRWVRTQPPHPSHARNCGLMLTSADIVLFLDDDVILRPDLLRRHHAHYVSTVHPRIIGVTGQLHTREPKVKAETVTLENFRKLTRPIQPDYGLEIGPPSCHPILASGNTSILRRSVMAAGGFDENFCFNEDRDLTFRLHAAHEGRLIYDPEAWIVHLRAPAGGCRASSTKPRSETQRDLPSVLFFLRHYRVMNWTWRRQLLKDSLRCGPLRRDNVLRVWRQPLAWCCLFLSVVRAICERQSVRSEINGNSYYG
jgi:glycosyltransferase involved in cell wall biosynthesis